MYLRPRLGFLCFYSLASRRIFPLHQSLLESQFDVQATLQIGMEDIWFASYLKRVFRNNIIFAIISSILTRILKTQKEKIRPGIVMAVLEIPDRGDSGLKLCRGTGFADASVCTVTSFQGLDC